MTNKFKRVNEHAQLGGVCGGLAYWLGVPTWIVRILVVVACLSGGIGVLAYLLVASFAPKWTRDPLDYSEVCE